MRVSRAVNARTRCAAVPRFTLTLMRAVAAAPAVLLPLLARLPPGSSAWAATHTHSATLPLCDVCVYIEWLVDVRKCV